MLTSGERPVQEAMMGARSGTACQRAASALRGSSSGASSAMSSAGCSAASSSPPKSSNASNFVLAGAFAASSRALSCSTQVAHKCRDATWQGVALLGHVLILLHIVPVTPAGNVFPYSSRGEGGGPCWKACMWSRTCSLAPFMSHGERKHRWLKGKMIIGQVSP